MKPANLIAADLIRIKKDRPLKIILLVGLGYGIMTLALFLFLSFVAGDNFNETRKLFGPALIGSFFDSGAFVVLCAVAIGIFNGSDFSFNTIRNKVIAGNSRLKIYFSQFAVNLIIFFGFFIVYAVFMTSLTAAIFTLPDFSDTLLRLLAALPLYICMIAIITMVAMTLRSRVGAIVTNLLILVLVPTLLSLVLIAVNDFWTGILESNPYSMLTNMLSASMTSFAEGMMGLAPAKLDGMVALKSLIVAVCYGGAATAIGAWRFTKVDLK